MRLSNRLPTIRSPYPQLICLNSIILFILHSSIARTKCSLFSASCHNISSKSTNLLAMDSRVPVYPLFFASRCLLCLPAQCKLPPHTSTDFYSLCQQNHSINTLVIFYRAITKSYFINCVLFCGAANLLHHLLTISLKTSNIILLYQFSSYLTLNYHENR